MLSVKNCEAITETIEKTNITEVNEIDVTEAMPRAKKLVGRTKAWYYS